GDGYRTLILGSVICDVTVVGVTESDQLPEEERIPGGGKLIEVMSDYSVNTTGGHPWDIIKYAEGIGNIGLGDYIVLISGLSPASPPDDGTLGLYLLNNVYDKDGSIFYKGYDFQGFSGIKSIKANDNSESRIYDLHGREVASPVSGSIYIRDGKKFVAE
ncbi:MAG: hypothetical protein K2M53_10775, partial [Muribaculaceae bacterium]|nr:hypothetical protein [Muribaculaceae bacterium]